MNFEAALPLIVGTALALVALTLVLSPLLQDEQRERPSADVTRARPGGEDEEDEASAVAALREIEFDRATGKLSDSDYAELKQRYTREALAELRAADAVSVASGSATVEIAADADPVEAAIRRAAARQRDCAVCGPRPEPDALYCSSCGRYLAGSCGRCGTPVELVGSRFCSCCGEQLAAA